MAPISLKKGKVDDLAEEFIQYVAGLKPGTDNFKIALEFALSNFRFHRFLDVNSFDVTRKFDGLSDKFLIHCKDSSASQLKSLKESYLNQPFSSSLFDTRTESHYGVLSLLLNLSQSPVNKADFLPKATISPEEEEHIDWAKYLLEGEETLSLGVAISEEQRVALEDDDDYDVEEFVGEDYRDRQALERHRSDRLPRNNDTFQDRGLNEQDQGDLQWLQKHIMHQYWKNEQCYFTTLNGSLAASEATSNLVIPFEENRGGSSITEDIVVRETLWLLQGLSTSYIYRYSNGEFLVRDDVRLSHVGQEALHNFISKFALSGSKIHKLKEFISTIPSMSPQQLRTRRAFGFALNSFFTKTRKELASIEFEIVNKEKHYTILDLTHELETVISSIDLVFDVYTACATAFQAKDMPANDAAVHTIDTLFHTVCRLDALGSTAATQVSVIVPIFLETLRPFLNDLGFWSHFGRLPPVGSDEFFIYEDEDAGKDDSEAWKNRFNIRRCWGDDTKLAVPQFLQDMTDKILLTGKSCGILEQAVNNINDQVFSGFEEEFFEKLFRGLGISWKKDDAKEEVEYDDVLLISKEFMLAGNDAQKLLIENFIVVFQRNFKIFDKVENFACKSNNIQILINDGDDVLTQNAPCRPPFLQIFNTSLHSLINSRYTQASNALLRLLTVRFRFNDHFNTVKNFFLMEAGDVLNEFYSEIFAKIRAKEYWQSTSYLTSVLHDALQLRFPQLINKLTVGIRTESRTSKNVSNVQSVDVIYLRYAMKWPLTIIFDSKAEETYNAVFSFLLQVKRALWSLERLRIKDLLKKSTVSSEQEPPDDVTVYRSKQPHDPASFTQKMYILRMRLLHFVQSFHTYIMTRILHSSGLEFKEKLVEAKDFEEILIYHQEFLEKVFDRCLLSPKVGFAKEAITRILNLSLNFQCQWDLGLGSVKQSDVEAIEHEFDKCSHFIQSFLNNLIKRGSFAHLELLSLSLKM